MDRIHNVSLAFVLTIAFATSAFACRDAQEGKPWRLQDASGESASDIIVPANATKGFPIGNTPVDRVHFCVRVLSSSPDTAIGLDFWTSATERNFYRLLVRNGKLQVNHFLLDKTFQLVPPTDVGVPKDRNGGMIEIDVKANGTGADVEIDGNPLANIVARPSARATSYGLIFFAGSDKPATFRLGPVLTYGDGR